MLNREQIGPLASETEQQIIRDDEEINIASEKHFISKKIRKVCCISIAAFLVIEAIVVVTLIFTIFKVKEPIIRVNGVSTEKFSPNNINNTTNMTMITYVSVKNPNYASFKFSNTTTSLFYHEVSVGEARGKSGNAKARRTMKMNVSVDISAARILSNPMFFGDLGSGLITINSFTRVEGRMKMLKIIKRHIIVKMNCTFVVNVTSQGIKEQKCKRKVKL